MAGYRRCSRCGGNVRAMSDYYGHYRICLQCSRLEYPPTVAKPIPEHLVGPQWHRGQPQ